ELQPRASVQARLLTVISTQPEKSWLVGDLLDQAQSSRASLNALLKNGIVTIQRTVHKRYATLEALSLADDSPDFQPNADQDAAIRAITRSLDKSKFQTFLLYGVTGSGKTLVYQKAIAHALKRGGTALLLIPEISLTPQMMGRFRKHFGERVALQHSAMSAGERTDIWRGIRDGEFPIVIGARSAVFAPLVNLKLIIVDEEGDSSFKQEEPNPRYHARDVALVRASQSGAVVVLGSATPSVETYYNAQKGRFTLIELPRRVDNVPAPVIRFEEPPRDPKRIIGDVLLQEIRKRTEQSEQVMLLQNRRGYFTFACCSSCGFLLRCRHCEITLTYHRVGHFLQCHVCGFKVEPPPLQCPGCGKGLFYAGIGTQRVENELAQILPNDNIIRLDLDTTGKRGAHHRILSGFAQQQYSVIVGTKMIARGHDYPKVTLVGVVSADTELAFPDFRSDERAFTLLTQVAGRSGRSARSESPGEVLIQTWIPEHPVLQLVKTGDYKAFYEREIKLRRSLQYPPAGWLVLFKFSGKDQEKTRLTAEKFANLAKARIAAIEWLGPVPAFHSKLKDHYRYHLLLKSPRQQRSLQSGLRKELHEIIGAFRKLPHRGVQLVVDVDPIQLQ
ncbi:MAG: primosomal protein N', partial [bacterium]